MYVIYCECGKITDCAALARLLLRLLNILSCKSIIHLKNSSYIQSKVKLTTIIIIPLVASGILMSVFLLEQACLLLTMKITAISTATITHKRLSPVVSPATAAGSVY